MWTAKTKFLFFCWLSFYIIWIPISVSKLLYFSRIIPNQITENINIHWYWYLYRNCLDIFPSDGQEWIHKERGNSFTRLSFVWRTLLINLKGFRTTWWKIKKKQGWVINKYKESKVDAKKFTWILCNIIDLLVVFTFEQRTGTMKSKIFTSVNSI